MEVSTIIFISLVLCGVKDVQADASLSELDTRVGQVERDIDAWTHTTGGNQIRMIKDFKKFESSLKEELTGTFVPTLIRRLVNQAITDILTEEYVNNIISPRVLHEVDSLKADFMTLNTSSVMMRNEVETCMDGLQKIQLKIPTDIQSLTSQLNQTKEDLLDTKEVISRLTEDFITLNTSSVKTRNKVESCMDDLQEIQLKLHTDIQSLTSQLNQTKEDLLDTKEVINGLEEDFITLNTSSVKTRNKVESCMDDLQEIQLKLHTDIQSLTSQLNQTKEDLLDTKEVINGLEEDFITLKTSSVKTRNKVESCMDDLQEIQLKLHTDIQSLTSQLNQTKEDLLDTKEVINGLEEDFITLNTSSVKTRNKVESCMDDLQEIQLKLHTDIQSLTSQLNQTKEDLLDTKEVINGLEEDFITLNTSSVKTRNKVESCMDGLQEIQLKLPTDIQSLTSQLNQTKEDLLDTKEVISRLTEDFITLNTSCGMRKEVKPSDGNEGSSLSQVSPTTPTTTYPGNTTASTDPSLSNTASLAPVTTQHSDLHASTDPSPITTVPPTPVTTQDSDLHATPSPAGRRLFSASKDGDLERVKRILAAGHVDINTRGYNSRTPVMAAAWGGHRDVVEFLVGRGADVSLVDIAGDNVLHWACSGGHLEIVKLIVSQNLLDINARDNNGNTAVDYARGWGHPRVVEFLVSRGGH